MENRMSKLPAIVVIAAVVVMNVLVLSKGADAPRRTDLGRLMPSTLQMMSDVRDLPSTAFVGP
jgi:hypothetical protein